MKIKNKGNAFSFEKLCELSKNDGRISEWIRKDVKRQKFKNRKWWLDRCRRLKASGRRCTSENYWEELAS